MLLKFKKIHFYILIVVISAVLIFSLINMIKESGQSSPRLPKVKVMKLIEREAPRFLLGYGRVVAGRKTKISSLYDGVITRIYISNGEYVNAGQPLFQLDIGENDSDLQAAKIKLKFNQLTYEREKELYMSRVTSRQQLDMARTKFMVAKDDVSHVKNYLNHAVITAPYSGVLTFRKVSLGSFVQQGMPLITLIGKSNRQLVYRLPADDANKLLLNQSVIFYSLGSNKKLGIATVSYISPVINPHTNSILLKANIASEDRSVYLGKLVTVRQVINPILEQAFLPDQAVLEGLNGPYVYRLVKGRVYYTKVNLGEKVGAYFQVLGGLNHNDIIVTEGQQNLSTNEKVKIEGGL